MLNTDELSLETKHAISGILWFLFLIPVAMSMHFLAKYYNVFWYTPMGWLIATLGAMQLGFGIARGGKRLFRLPLRSKHPVTN